MKAIVYERYGAPDVLELRDIEVPSVTDGGVLVRIRAASTNPYDWHFMRGTPLLMRGLFGWFRPKAHGLGADLRSASGTRTWFPTHTGRGRILPSNTATTSQAPSTRTSQQAATLQM